MDDLSPSGLARRGRRPPESQEGRRRSFGALFSRLKRKPMAPLVGSSNSEMHSAPSQEVSLNFEASSNTGQVVDSPLVVTCPTTQQMGTDAIMTEAPPLIAEKDEGDRRNLRIADESSIESLQADLDFVLKQHAIMDQIMGDQSRIDSNDRSMRSNPSTDDVTSRSSLRQDCRPSRNSNKMNLDDIDQEENDDFLHFLNDPAILEEQRRIMNDIVGLSPHSLTGHAEPPPLKPSPPNNQALWSSALAHSSPTRVVNDEIMGYIEEAATCMSVLAPIARQEQVIHHVRRASSEPRSRQDITIIAPFPRRAESVPLIVDRGCKESPTEDETRQFTKEYEQDAHVKVYQGKRIQVRGTNHTWKKIAKGNATLVQCPVCSTILQVGASARLLFCTKCNEVSPISAHMNSSMDYRADGLIAVVVQQQEVDVAFAMKMARNVPPKKK